MAKLGRACGKLEGKPVPGRNIRILILLAVLAWVAVDVLAARLNTTDWEQPLWVGVYPINADGSDRAAKYIQRLSEEDFDRIESWFREEAGRHGRNLPEPVSLRLGPALTEHPPVPPADGSIFGTAWWSVKLRWWADDNDTLPNGLDPDVRLYLLFHDPQASPRLPHSLGLAKGLVGVVHLFADRRQDGANQVVIAHELMHTLGASDKYDAANTQPRHPEGFAEPDRKPLYPQSLAEIMGGRIPLGPAKSEIPGDLGDVRVGPVTAREIRWR